jgi:hypothetical protein
MYHTHDAGAQLGATKFVPNERIALPADLQPHCHQARTQRDGLLERLAASAGTVTGHVTTQFAVQLTNVSIPTGRRRRQIKRGGEVVFSFKPTCDRKYP